MIASDVHAVLLWWFIFFLLGIGFLPVTFALFDKFFDKGYIFSKLLGLAFTSYAIFLLGVLHIVPFNQISAFIIFFIMAGGSFFLLPRKWKILYNLKKTWRIFIIEEILFLAALFFWSYIHSFAPDIHGLEKYMDYGFINSILRSDYFPPKDMWFTPLFINYYYFGHIMTAILTKLSGIPSLLTFNLMLSTIFAFCVTEAFSIGANFYTMMKKDARVAPIKRFLSGILTAALVAFAGNLHILHAFFKAYENEKPVALWQLAFNPAGFPNAYWYPNATRFIHNTIHEFPIYSWVVADLHGHVLDIPFVLLTIALLLAIFAGHDIEDKTDEEETEKKKLPRFPFADKIIPFFAIFEVHPLILLLLGFLLSVMYMTNAWDGAIYLMLTMLVLFYLYWQKIPAFKSRFYKEEALDVIASPTAAKKKQNLFVQKWFLSWGREVVLSFLFIITGFVLVSLPYNYYFKPFVSGIGVLCAPDFLTKIGKIGPLLFEVNHCQHSPWWQLLLLYGFFYFFVLCFIGFILRTKKVLHSDIFILLLIILATFLIILPEFIYVKDIYPAHYRANTMFKLVFQAFMMLGICSSYIIFRLLAPDQAGNGSWTKSLVRYALFFPATLVLLSLVLTYPYLAVNSYYGNLLSYKGLDGTKYLKVAYPSDYAAITWLNEHVKGQPVILEAQGDSYTDYARVSANTGLPTVLGWTVHEWLWRGTYSIPAPRIEEIKKMYETTDAKVAKDLLKKYKVKYIFVGAMERQKYPAINEATFKQLGKVVYENGTTRVYEVK